MYLKLNNGVIEKYPYTIGELRKDNNQTSFPANIHESLLNEYNVFKVESVEQPSVGFDKNVTEGQPELVDGVWKQVWTVTNATAEEHLNRILSARANEYPPMSDYLDGIVKGDQAQIDTYIAACQAVKTKYPKGA
jgi:hypothetical protein